MHRHDTSYFFLDEYMKRNFLFGREIFPFYVLHGCLSYRRESIVPSETN